MKKGNTIESTNTSRQILSTEYTKNTSIALDYTIPTVLWISYICPQVTPPNPNKMFTHTPLHTL